MEEKRLIWVDANGLLLSSYVSSAGKHDGEFSVENSVSNASASERSERRPLEAFLKKVLKCLKSIQSLHKNQRRLKDLCLKKVAGK